MAADKLKILGMTFHAYHGLDEHEKINGQRFEVDIELAIDCSIPATTDKLKDTVDVRQVYHAVHDIVLNKRFYLVETVAEEIASSVLRNFDTEQVLVRVRKPVAPLGGLANGTEVEIVRNKNR